MPRNSKKFSIEREDPIQLSKGIEGLLGTKEAEPKNQKKSDEQSEAVASPVRKRRTTQVQKEQMGDDQDQMSTLSLRFHRRYQDRLEKLYLQEKLKGNKIKKWQLLEEALHLLFVKYDVQQS